MTQPRRVSVAIWHSWTWSLVNKRNKAGSGAECLFIIITTFIYLFKIHLMFRIFLKTYIALRTLRSTSCLAVDWWGSGVGALCGHCWFFLFFFFGFLSFLTCSSQYFLVKNSFWFYSSYHTFSQRPSLPPNKLSVLAANCLIRLKQVPLFLLTQATWFVNRYLSGCFLAV